MNTQNLLYRPTGKGFGKASKAVMKIVWSVEGKTSVEYLGSA
ncbi:MAG: hypothetical protein ACO3LN_15255 [bacterium]